MAAKYSNEPEPNNDDIDLAETIVVEELDSDGEEYSGM